MMEEWRDITGYEGMYQVSNLGHVRSLDRVVNSRPGLKQSLCGKALKINNCAGYSVVGLHKNGITKNKLVHRLVAIAFLTKPFGKNYINHKDYDPSNNRVDNLEWCTQAENIAYSMGHIREGKRKNQGRPVIAINVVTGNMFEFECMNDAEKYGFSQGSVGMCCQGKRKTHKGYKWFYAD